MSDSTVKQPLETLRNTEQVKTRGDAHPIVDLADPSTRELAMNPKGDSPSHAERRRTGDAHLIDVVTSHLKDYLPRSTRQMSEIKHAFESVAGDGPEALRQFVKDVNERLKLDSSDVRVAIGPKDPKDPSKMSFESVDLDGVRKPLASVDTKPAVEHRRGEDIADVMATAKDGLTKSDKAAIENVLKAAYKEGGQAAVDSLLKAANTQLQSDASDFRLVRGKSTLKTFEAQAFDLFDQRDSSIKKFLDFDASDPPSSTGDAKLGRRTAQLHENVAYLDMSPLANGSKFGA